LGQKANVDSPKKLLGSVKNGAIQLCEPENILGVCEGLETSLAVHEATKQPVWAAVSAGNMETLVIPKNVTEVHVWSDRDANNAGLKAAEKLAERLHEQGKQIYIHLPPNLENNNEKGCDWLDVLNQKGSTPFIESLENTKAWEPYIDPKKLVCLSDVTEQKVDFLWRPYLPLGKVSILVGDGEVGKSWITLSLATAISNGSGIPGKENFEPGVTLIFNGEDGIEDTIKPRLTQLGANQDLIFAYKAPVALNDAGIREIEKYIRIKKPLLVTIDPIQAYLGGSLDMNRANQVRSALTPLVTLANKYNCTFLLVGHLNKDSSRKASYRILGSTDFGAVCRSVLLAGLDQQDEAKRAIFHLKSNLAQKGNPIGYEINENKFSWLDKTDLTLDRVLSNFTDTTDKKSVLNDAIDFMSNFLAEGPKSAPEVIKAGEDNGFSEKTIYRAKKILNVKSVKTSQFGNRGKGHWNWKLPDEDSDQDGQGHDTQGLTTLNPEDEVKFTPIEPQGFQDNEH